MLTVIRDANGLILSAAEWVPCDSAGIPSNYGNWIWLNQLEQSEGSGVEPIKQLIMSIADQMPQAIGAYWRREGKTGQEIHQYTRERLLSFALGNHELEHSVIV